MRKGTGNSTKRNYEIIPVFVQDKLYDMDLYLNKLQHLYAAGCLRSLPEILPAGKYVMKKEGKDIRQMLNLSSNDYLGLAGNQALRQDFLQRYVASDLPFSSSSSRLLTGNYPVYTDLEQLIASRFGCEASLLFNSGYHANLGILPAVTDKQTLILADKLVHASLIDGIRLSGASFVRYRHNDYGHLEDLLKKEQGRYARYIIVTESIFSMDGDVADLRYLVALKERYPHILLYVDEAHAIGVRGEHGLGIAEETGTIGEIDFLVGTFGKALASVGAYVVCKDTVKQYLVNTMRPLIFSTGLPPVNIAWSYYIFERLENFQEERKHLEETSRLLNGCITQLTGKCTSSSHIIPYIIGENEACIRCAGQLQEGGFYCLPVRPPTVPAGTSRIRFSLTASITVNEIKRLMALLVSGK